MARVFGQSTTSNCHLVSEMTECQATWDTSQCPEQIKSITYSLDTLYDPKTALHDDTIKPLVGVMFCNIKDL